MIVPFVRVRFPPPRARRAMRRDLFLQSLDRGPSATLSGFVAFLPVEALENARQIVFGVPILIIAHVNSISHKPVVPLPGAQPDPRHLARIFHGLSTRL